MVLVSSSLGEVGRGWRDAGEGWPSRWLPRLSGSAMHTDPGALPQGGQNWKQLFPQEDDEGAPCPAEDELALQDNGFLSKNEVLRNKVSRLTERLRKRYPTNNFGTAQGRAGWGAPRPWGQRCWVTRRARSKAVSIGPWGGSTCTEGLRGRERGFLLVSLSLLNLEGR